ncbi:MAG TPA: fibronectin type III domain-containing protein [Cytophagales bacterium]|nr:fibronectin type III domain-containing protein [Cytophagales bacterium]
MKKLLLFFTLGCLILITSKSFSQTIEPAPYYDMTSWDSSPYKSFKITGGNANPWYDMTFRLLFPKTYDSSLVSTENYPLVIMLHGAGESALGGGGPSWPAYPSNDPRRFNNDHQLIHQGNTYITRINASPTSKKYWPGFVLFPQNPNGFWTGQAWFLNEVIEMVQVLCTNLKIDPNRIYISGLSSGSHGAWDGLARFTNLFAAANIMSGIGYPTYDNTNRVAHIPIWYFQGGNDNSPSPYTANQTITALRNVGGTPKYTVYPNNGHDTWNSAIGEEDYLPFLLDHSKLSIHAYYGKTEFCAGETINVKLEISPGFSGYEWKKDDVLIPGATANNITVTQVGNYTVRFRRGSQWTAWSTPAVIKIKTPTATPVITANGSTALSGLDGSTNVTLTAPAGYASYKWSTNSTNQSITVNSAGSYTVQVTEAEGCISAPSTPVVVTVGNGSNTPAAPSNFVATASSPTILDLTWNDNSSNETGFEVYKANSSNGPYTFLGLLGQNINTYSDTNLEPNTTYFYKVRAINNNGSSSVLSGSGTTAQDLEAPSIPQNLIYVASIPTEIYLSWTASTDYVGVTGYQIYVNGALAGSTENTSYTLVATPGEMYSIYVKATDKSGNLSPQSNQVAAGGINKGLKYSYYEGTWDLLPDFSALTPAATGYVSNVTLTPRLQDNNFAMQFEGYFYATETGTYTFYTSSDDGSKLYIGATEVVNNDGLHGTQERSGTIALTPGAYPIRITFFEKGGGEVLQARYQLTAGGISKQLIPDVAFADYNLSSSLPTSPNSLVAEVAAYNRINLTWTDRSDNETGFEIYRSTTNNSNHQLIATVDAETTTYADLSLSGSTRYYYKVRAINDNGSSTFSNEVNKTTPVSPNTPNVPNTLVATADSPSQINVSWNDNSSNETGFEVHRSTMSNGAYTLVYSAAAGVTSFIDNNLDAYTTYYYKVRAVNSGAYSAFSSIVNARTLTHAPIFVTIGNKTATEGSRLDLTLTATDEDGDLITFSATGLPSFVAIANNFGVSATLTINPGYAHSGVYEGIVITANDGKGGIDTETISITVNNVNRAPQLAAIGNAEVNELSDLIIDLSGTDADGDTISFSATGLPSFATFSNSGSGTGSINVNPEIGDAGSYNVTVTVTDANTDTSSETFTLKVNKLNLNAPVIATIGNKTLDENTNQSYALTASDADGDAVTLSATGLPSFATFTSTGNGTGTLAVAPSYSHSGVYSNVIISANDGNGGSSTQTISITVNNVNRAPIVAQIGTQSINEGTSLTVNIIASDADGDVLTLTATNLPADFSAFTNTGNGTATLKFSPGFSNSGTYNNVTITVVDGNGGTDTESFTLNVEDVVGGSQTIIYRVNSGGEALTATPISWEGDTYASPSQYLTNPSGSSLTEGGCWWPDHTNTTGTSDCIFGSFRFDWGAPIKYDFPVANGNYIINLFFAQKKNTWPPDYQHVAGDHLFDVFIESALVLDNMDMFAENGFNAIKKSFNVEITDGHINIDLFNVINSPQINGIEIISVVGAESGANARFADEAIQIEESNKVTVLPNPLSAGDDQVILTFDKLISEEITVSMFDNFGSSILSRGYQVDYSNSITIDLTGIYLNPGIYLIQVNSNTLNNQTLKLLKE